MAVLEGPEDGQEVAGIGIIRGWAFSDTAGVSITQVTLVVDGTSVTSIPCCSERGDVVAAFPQLPSENTLNSGFGITQNYNLNTAGTHTIGVEVRDSSGAQQHGRSALSDDRRCIPSGQQCERNQRAEFRPQSSSAPYFL